MIAVLQPDGSLKIYETAQESLGCPEGYSEVCSTPWWIRVSGICRRTSACVCCVQGGPPAVCKERLDRFTGEAMEEFPPDPTCP